MALIFSDIVKLADAGVVYRGGNARFLSKSALGRRIKGGFERLQRDGTIQAGVMGLINEAHNSLTQFSHNPVGTELCPRLQWTEASHGR